MSGRRSDMMSVDSVMQSRLMVNPYRMPSCLHVCRACSSAAFVIPYGMLIHVGEHPIALVISLEFVARSRVSMLVLINERD